VRALLDGEVANTLQPKYLGRPEFYGGLGDAHSFGLQYTSHYLGPGMSWKLSDRQAIKADPHFGLTRESQRVLLHFAVIYDVPEFGRRLGDLFQGR
jgi:hypothetical protein